MDGKAYGSGAAKVATGGDHDEPVVRFASDHMRFWKLSRVMKVICLQCIVWSTVGVPDQQTHSNRGLGLRRGS